MATEEQHATAVIALLSSLNAVPYDLSDVPKVSLPASYTEVYVSRIVGGNPVRLGFGGSESYRIALRAVGQNYVDNARNVRAKAAGIEYRQLTVAGVTTSPILFETAEVIGPDGDSSGAWFSGLSTYTYYTL